MPARARRSPARAWSWWSLRRRPSRPPTAAFRGTREIYFAEAGRVVDTPSYDRAVLLANNRIAGPVVIEEYASTTVVHPGDEVDVDAFGDLVIEILRS